NTISTTTCCRSVRATGSRSRSSSLRSGRSSGYTELKLRAAAAQPADRSELRQRTGELALGLSDLFLRCLVLHRFLGALLCLQRLRLVEIARADRGVGQHRHDVGLHLEETALHEDDLLFVLSRQFDAYLAGLDLRDQRRVLGIDAELAHDAGQNDELRLAGVDRLGDADDVDVDRVGHYCSVFAFSTASSIAPIM